MFTKTMDETKKITKCNTSDKDNRDEDTRPNNVCNHKNI